METKVKCLSANQIIENARERVNGMDEYINKKAELIVEQHQSIEDAEN